MKQRITFFGSGEYTIPVVKKLLNRGLDLVVTTEKSGKLINFCKENRIPHLSTNLSRDEDAKTIQNLNPTVAILASYGAMIPKKIISAFTHGIINIHPSLLPKYKGPSPIQYTLLNGEKTTGVTLIKLDNEIDHGPILSQKKYKLDGDETTKDLLDTLFELGAQMVEELVIELESGEKLSETPQDHSKESWSYKIEKKDGEINLDNPPGEEELNNMIRAYYPWPGVWLKAIIKNQAAKGEPRPKGRELRIKLLPNNNIQVEGKNVMSYKDFENGYGKEGKKILEKLLLI